MIRKSFPARVMTIGTKRGRFGSKSNALCERRHRHHERKNELALNFGCKWTAHAVRALDRLMSLADEASRGIGISAKRAALRLVARNTAKIGFEVHPHMLRHATGYVLANRGTDTRTLQAYLGHRSIQSTVRYTEPAPNRFKNLWRI
jgi:integrase